MHWIWGFVVILAAPFVAKEGMGAALWSGSLPGFSIFGCYVLKHRELSWTTKGGNTILFWKVSKNCIAGGLEMVCQELSGKQPYVYTWSSALSKQQKCCPWHLKTKWLNAEVTVLWLTILMRASTYLGLFRAAQQWEGWRPLRLQCMHTGRVKMPFLSLCRLWAPKPHAVACALSLDLCLPHTWSFPSALLLLSQ